VIDAQSQALSKGLIENADLVLFVVDSSGNYENEIASSSRSGTPRNDNPRPQGSGLNQRRLNELVVYNKCDLAGELPADGLRIIAKTGSGVQELIAAIEQRLGVADFDIKKTVCFTERQKGILEQIVNSDAKKQIKQLVMELLNGVIVRS
jgi:tRNA U34 5-carboxymethylaminomethyl modifying GTPase MnmE/TrmE